MGGWVLGYKSSLATVGRSAGLLPAFPRPALASRPFLLQDASLQRGLPHAVPGRRTGLADAFAPGEPPKHLF